MMRCIQERAVAAHRDCQVNALYTSFQFSTHHLAVFKSILTKDFNQVANNEQEMISLIKAHAALKQAQMDPDAMMRKFLSDTDAKNMLEMKSWDRTAGAMVDRVLARQAKR